jgi:hypothetical protein
VKASGKRCSDFSSTLKMETICSYETSVEFQWTTLRCIPGYRTLRNHRCEKLKSYEYINSTLCFRFASGIQTGYIRNSNQTCYYCAYLLSHFSSSREILYPRTYKHFIASDPESAESSSQLHNLLVILIYTYIFIFGHPSGCCPQISSQWFCMNVSSIPLIHLTTITSLSLQPEEYEKKILRASF